MSEIRTPPSLKWLINRRARLSGEIEKLKRRYPIRLAAEEEAVNKARHSFEMAQNQVVLLKSRFEMSLKVLTADLEAIDNTLKQHEIQISPELISPIVPQDSQRLVPYGEITRAIFSCLKFVGDSSLSTTDLTVFIASLADREISDKEFMELRDRVAKRLKVLCREGKILRIHRPKTNVEGRWRLPINEGASTPLWGRNISSES